LLADEPIVNRVNTLNIDPNKVNATFNPPVQSATPLDLSSKYPQLNTIFAEQPNISVRDLAGRLGVSTGTAQKIKTEWLDTHKPKQPEKKALPEGTLLSKAEAEEMKETLAAALADDFRYLDEYLASRLKNTHPDEEFSAIWDNLDEDEIQKLTSVMVRGGQHNPAMATVARGLVNSRDYVVTAAIVLPRAKKTLDVVRKTHRPPMRRGAQNANQH
jgi:hypothetical protein